MSDRQDTVDHTFQAVARLRRLLREHELSGEEDTPFHLGIREALDDYDAVEQERSSAA